MFENPLKDWENERDKLVVKRVLQSGLEFTLENVPNIISEMSYINQKNKNPTDCPCYSSEPCHKGVKDFNCFLCNCPQYDSSKEDENGEITGGCKIGSKKGKFLEQYPSPSGRVWDCSSCPAYHAPRVVVRYLRDNMEKYQRLAESIKKERKINLLN